MGEVSELLMAARDVLDEPSHWVRYTLVTADDEKHCAVGAVMHGAGVCYEQLLRAADDKERFRTDWVDGLSRRRLVLRAGVNRAVAMLESITRERGRQTISGFNDCASTTFEDIRSVFDEAIRRAKEIENE